MATTNEYLNQLQKDKQNLIDNLNTMGVESYDNETFTDLAPKVLEVKGKLQTKTTKASESSDVIVNPDTGFDGMSQVTVSKIVASDINNLEASNIKRGTTILGVEGTFGPTSQVKNATPSTSAQVIVPDEGIEFMSAVNLAPVTSAIDTDIKSENIKTGVEILGTLGTYSGDVELQENKDVLPTTTQQIIKADEGFDGMSQVTVSAVDSSIDSNIVPNNIKKGISILSVQGTYEPEPTQSKSVTPTTNSQIITPDEGYSGLSQVTVNAVTSSIDGNIQPENIKDGVNILGVTGSLPEFIPESIIINPTTEQQIITPTPGKTAITNITVSPVTNEIDVNIQPENIKVNKTILGVMGEYAGDDVKLQEKEVTPSSIDANTIFPDEGYTGLSRVVVNPVPTDTITITPTQETQTISRDGQLPLGEVIVNGVTSNVDSNIQPENIKQNMSILGVVGTYVGDIQTYFGPLSKGTSSVPGILSSLLKIPENLVVSGTDTSYLFYHCKSITELPLLDYSKITKADYMFADCGVTNYGALNFPKLESASNLFYGSKVSGTTFVFPSLSDGSNLFNNVYLNEDNATFNITLGDTTKNLNSFLGIKNASGNNFSGCTVNITTTADLLNIDSSNAFMSNASGIDNLHIDSKIRLANLSRFAGNSSNTAADGEELSLDIGWAESASQAFRFRGFKTINFTGNAVYLKDISNMFSKSGITLTNFSGIPGYGMFFNNETSNDSTKTLDLHYAVNLTHESLMNVINNLYNIAQYNKTQQLILGSTNLAKLTEDEIAIATAKGWTVS